MAALLHFCVFFLICVSLAHGVVNKLCNNEFTDCDSGECCAATGGSPVGYTGECQKYKTINERCTPEEPEEGECGCMRHMVCARSFSEGAERDTYSCRYVKYGR